MNRQAFIQTSGRLGMLAILAIVVGILLKNKQITAKPSPDQKCRGCSLDPSNCKKKNCHPGLDPGSKTENQTS